MIIHGWKDQQPNAVEALLQPYDDRIQRRTASLIPEHYRDWLRGSVKDIPPHAELTEEELDWLLQSEDKRTEILTAYMLAGVIWYLVDPPLYGAILSYDDIMEWRRVLFPHGFTESSVESAHYELRLDTAYPKWKIGKENKSNDGIVTLSDGDEVVFYLKERVYLPQFVSAQIINRAGLASHGIKLMVTQPDNGYFGWLAVRVECVGVPYKFHDGDALCKLEFKTGKLTSRPYIRPNTEGSDFKRYRETTQK